MKEQPSFMCSSIRQSGANLFIGIWYDLISCIRMISFLDILQKQFKKWWNLKFEMIPSQYNCLQKCFAINLVRNWGNIFRTQLNEYDYTKITEWLLVINLIHIQVIVYSI